MGEKAEFCDLVDGALVKMSPSFLPEARVVRMILLLEFAKLTPDLAVEVISPEVKYSCLQRKIRHYFEAGARLLWIVDPDLQTVTVYRSPVDLGVLTAADTPSGEDVLPGLSRSVTELFA
jgi:Uma2 family endonuclease